MIDVKLGDLQDTLTRLSIYNAACSQLGRHCSRERDHDSHLRTLSYIFTFVPSQTFQALGQSGCSSLWGCFVSHPRLRDMLG